MELKSKCAKQDKELYEMAQTLVEKEEKVMDLEVHLEEIILKMKGDPLPPLIESMYQSVGYINLIS